MAVVGRQQDVLDKMVDEQPDPERWLAIEADVRDSDAMHAAVARTIERFGKLDTLVPNAGVWDFQRQLTRLSGAEVASAFDELFAINVKGYLLAAEAAWRELVKTQAAL